MSKRSKSETEHFRAAMKDVRPLRSDNRHPPAPPPGHGRSQGNPGLRESTATALLSADASIAGAVVNACEQGKPLLRDGLPRKALRTLGTAHNPVADSFDLHGMNESQARKALLDFLAHCLGEGMRCVRVVHGKGLRSQGPAVLRLMSWLLLWQHPGVLALKPCDPKDGGSGAVLVLLGSLRGART